MKIEVDINSGFCFGVIYAIKRAEEELNNTEKLYCLGDIVHNNVEVERLENLGLQTIKYKDFQKLKTCKVLFRAHGEPPATYRTALNNQVKIIDATCPVVSHLQIKIGKGYQKAQEINGQVVIYGKKGHAEVNGLVGQTQGNAIVVANETDLNQIDYNRPIIIFSQTTQSQVGYDKIINHIKQKITEKNIEPKTHLTINKTICGRVANRDKELSEFVKKFDLILFVSGKKSSNGKMLYEICKKNNRNTHFISEIAEIDFQLFNHIKSVGICGATSTPRWFMEKIKHFIEKNL